ncbi:polar amino acid transport system substrate-binding protein [Kineosphaera limosa]|uniref:Putative ABC transporter substrate-binding protein n=1 Tax=Kineosphaera limosa NBRC 100340 TaxID=1184609 RepID=K6W695_9MICO|nr:transporter substrate-binding domain-containing protein [Kineosphaera limosa]NYD99338.1 polar amino acid transport system substrate-binding protein [Kineosphaera limosa]GAB94705.1 putative ABC transporter substrate-binding protein [Kineosphaera limosa NBRC 100340]
MVDELVDHHGGEHGDVPQARAELAATGALRAHINLGNPVLTHGTPQDPGGVSVDIAREAARRLGVPVEFTCVDAARHSFDALVQGRADLAFLADEPARAAQVAFTPPYVLIEGVFVVPDDSPITTVQEADRPGVRIGVKEGSAYDLYLTRTLAHAQLVRGAEGVDVYLDEALEAGAGVRQPATRWVQEHPGHRVVPQRFQEIAQCAATRPDLSQSTLAWVAQFVEELKASGFIADSLARAGQEATVAPPRWPAAAQVLTSC